MTPLKDYAIKLALECKWKEACKANEELLEEDPDDIDTLNRLGFALIQTNAYTKARDAFQKVIEIDESNPIASKNLKKIETLAHQTNNNTNNHTTSRISMFIEEAGKTKTVSLVNIADKKTISNTQPGQQVNLTIKRSKIFIQTEENTYLGMLPHDLSVRLIEFLREGNKYEAYLKAVNEKEIMVFIKELQRSKKFANHPSFPTITPAKKIKRKRV